MSPEVEIAEDIDDHRLVPYRPWPQVGKVLNGVSIGTGFLVGRGYVLTARHVIRGARNVIFELASHPFEAEVFMEYEEEDIAILKILGGNIPDLHPMKLCRIPRDLPASFYSYGYRRAKRDRFDLLQGRGSIEAELQPHYLQLSTTTHRPGMSGAPIGLYGKDGIAIVAIVRARFNPAEESEKEPDLGWAQAISGIPEDILARIGTLEDFEEDHETSKADAILTEVLERKEKLIKSISLLRYISVAAALLFIVLALLDVIPRLDLLPWVGILLLIGSAAHLFAERERRDCRDYVAAMVMNFQSRDLLKNKEFIVDMLHHG